MSEINRIGAVIFYICQILQGYLFFDCFNGQDPVPSRVKLTFGKLNEGLVVSRRLAVGIN